MKKIGLAVSAFIHTVLLAIMVPVVEAHAQNELTDVGCAQEDRLRSTDGSISTQVTFINRSALTIRTYWLNYQGKRVFYSDIAPGRSHVQQTYVTHPWVITNNPSGNCVAIYQPARTPATVVIR